MLPIVFFVTDIFLLPVTKNASYAQVFRINTQIYGPYAPHYPNNYTGTDNQTVRNVMSIDAAVQRINELEQEHWIDSYTAVVVAYLVLYNPVLGMKSRDENNVGLGVLKLKEKEILLARRPGGCTPRTPCLCYPFVGKHLLKVDLESACSES